MEGAGAWVFCNKTGAAAHSSLLPWIWNHAVLEVESVSARDRGARAEPTCPSDHF